MKIPKRCSSSAVLGYFLPNSEMKLPNAVMSPSVDSAVFESKIGTAEAAPADGAGVSEMAAEGESAGDEGRASSTDDEHKKSDAEHLSLWVVTKKV